MEATGTLTRLKDFLGQSGTDIGAYLATFDQTSLLGGCLFGIIVVGTLIVTFLILGKHRSADKERGSSSERRISKMEGKLTELSNNWGSFLSNVRDDIGFIKQEIQELKVQLDFVQDIEKLHDLLTEANKRMVVQLENHKSDQVLIACELREIRVSQAKLEAIANAAPKVEIPKVLAPPSVKVPTNGTSKANGSSDHSETRKAAQLLARSKNEHFFVD